MWVLTRTKGTLCEAPCEKAGDSIDASPYAIYFFIQRLNLVKPLDSMLVGLFNTRADFRRLKVKSSKKNEEDQMTQCVEVREVQISNSAGTKLNYARGRK